MAKPQWYAKSEAEKKAAVTGQQIKREFGSWYSIYGPTRTETEDISAARIQEAATKAGPVPASQGGTGTPASDIGGETVPNGTSGTQTQTQAPAPTGLPSGVTGKMGDLSRRAIQEAGLVYGMDIPAPTVPAGLRPEMKTVAEEAGKAFEYEKPVIAAEARKAQRGLETMGEATFEYQAALSDEIRRMGTSREELSQTFAGISKMVVEYAGEAAARTELGLQQIDRWGKEMAEKLEFSRAYDMEVAVMSTVDSMNQIERQTLQQYGADSDEYRQFQQVKGKTLAGILTATQASYAKLQTEIGINIFQAKADFKTQSDMYGSFETQKSWDTQMAAANSDAAYALDSAGFIVQQEMMKMGGWQDWANWQIETPIFAIDSMGTTNFIAQLVMGEWQAEMASSAAKKAAEATESAGKSQAIGSVAGAIATALILMI